jgi:hypothetical protein
MEDLDVCSLHENAGCEDRMCMEQSVIDEYTAMEKRIAEINGGAMIRIFLPATFSLDTVRSFIIPQSDVVEKRVMLLKKRSMIIYDGIKFSSKLHSKLEALCNYAKREAIKYMSINATSLNETPDGKPEWRFTYSFDADTRVDFNTFWSNGEIRSVEGTIAPGGSLKRAAYITECYMCSSVMKIPMCHERIFQVLVATELKYLCEHHGENEEYVMWDSEVGAPVLTEKAIEEKLVCDENLLRRANKKKKDVMKKCERLERSIDSLKRARSMQNFL